MVLFGPLLATRTFSTRQHCGDVCRTGISKLAVVERMTSVQKIKGSNPTLLVHAFLSKTARSTFSTRTRMCVYGEGGLHIFDLISVSDMEAQQD